MKEKKHSILIIDDIPLNIKILGEALRKDYNVAITTDGRQAMEIVESDETRPDLIILDIIMPNIDGYEVCKNLKDSPKTREIPIIFITTKDKADDEVMGFEAGGVDYITKPFNIATVLARIKTHLELKEKKEMLEKIAALDSLTNLPNRRRLDETLNTEWRRAVRGETSISIALIDIDYFKKYNDFYGHPKGDDCLIRVSSILKDSLKRPADFLARYGGEEFLVILPETGSEAALKVGNRLKTDVEMSCIKHECSDPYKKVTISVGVATIAPDKHTCLSPEDLIKQADTALYKSKNNGRNCVSCVVVRE